MNMMIPMKWFDIMKMIHMKWFDEMKMIPMKWFSYNEDNPYEMVFI